MDIEQTTEQRLLAHAERQTSALESLRGLVLFWTAVGALALVIALITWVNGSR